MGQRVGEWGFGGLIRSSGVLVKALMSLSAHPGWRWGRAGSRGAAPAAPVTAPAFPFTKSWIKPLSCEQYYPPKVSIRIAPSIAGDKKSEEIGYHTDGFLLERRKGVCPSRQRVAFW